MRFHSVSTDNHGGDDGDDGDDVGMEWNDGCRCARGFSVFLVFAFVMVLVSVLVSVFVPVFVVGVRRSSVDPGPNLSGRASCSVRRIPWELGAE